MSIKRRSTGSTKSTARKPVTSSTRQRVEILPTRKMVPGDEYLGWLCKNSACGLLIAIADVAAADAVAGKTPILDEPDHLAAVTCPHCQNEDLYRWNARVRRPYVPKSA